MTRTTKKCNLFAVTGYPLTHSLSPAMHMATIRTLKMEGLYIPLEIQPDSFKTVMKNLGSLPFQGLNVTVPYKEQIIPFLDSLSPEAEAIGAVNTVVFGKKLVGHNTDAYGFIRSLEEDLHFNAAGKCVVLIGAGGAARACIYGLAQQKVRTICVAEVDKKKAERLVQYFKTLFPAIQFVVMRSAAEDFKAVLGEVDLLVNASPVGLKKTDPLLVPRRCFPAKELAVYDLVYNPRQTKLLGVAKKKGCRVANGAGMLVHQGARSFELWTGRKAIVADMRKALFAALGQK